MVDAEQVRAAVTVALDASMAKMVDEIASRVLAALNSRKPEPPADDYRREAAPVPSPVIKLALPEPLRPALRQPAVPQPAQGLHFFSKGFFLH